MTLETAFLAGGALLIFIGLSTDLIRRSVFTTPLIYLGAGLLVGPSVLGWLHFNPLAQAGTLELVTEIAVLLSLFTAGMKMPMPLRWPRWRAAIRLAFVGVAISVALMAGFLHLALGLPLGAAVLLAAILTPTDPVLATDVQIRHPGDRERLRFGLTSEGGLNDGSAFPFVVLGMGLLGLDGGFHPLDWLLVDVIQATVLAAVIGWCGGAALAHGAFLLRADERDRDLLDDFLGLGLIGVVYGLCLFSDSWGFIGVFVAALSLRHHELRLYRQTRALWPDAGEPASCPRVSERSLGFKEQLERLCELALVLLIGCTLFPDSWSWRAVAVAAFLFLVARPLSVLLCLRGLRLPPRILGLTAWFGVRGIGSLYYLSYAVTHGLPQQLALEMIHITLVVVSLSILVHGFSLRPLMQRFGRTRRRRRPAPTAPPDPPAPAGHRDRDARIIPFADFARMPPCD